MIQLTVEEIQTIMNVLNNTDVRGFQNAQHYLGLGEKLQTMAQQIIDEQEGVAVLSDAVSSIEDAVEETEVA